MVKMMVKEIRKKDFVAVVVVAVVVGVRLDVVEKDELMAYSKSEVKW